MDNEGVKEIAELAREAAGVSIQLVEEPSIRGELIRLASVPRADGGADIISIKALLDEWRTAPERIEGTAKALTLTSFVDLMNRHKSGDSAVFGDLNVRTPSLTGVVDYHTVSHEPAWARHRVSYAFPISDEWATWRQYNGKTMPQADWAAFIEDRIADLSSPYDQEVSTFEQLFRTKVALPSDLITLSRGLSIKVDTRVAEHRTLATGEAEITFEEVHNDATGKKRLVVPGLFMIEVPFFVGAEPDRIACRLRYRVNEGRIVWFYQMYRPDVVVRQFLERTLIDVAEKTALPAFEAMPEA